MCDLLACQGRLPNTEVVVPGTWYVIRETYDQPPTQGQVRVSYLKVSQIGQITRTGHRFPVHDLDLSGKICS